MNKKKELRINEIQTLQKQIKYNLYITYYLNHRRCSENQNTHSFPNRRYFIFNHLIISTFYNISKFCHKMLRVQFVYYGRPKYRYVKEWSECSPFPPNQHFFGQKQSGSITLDDTSVQSCVILVIITFCFPLQTLCTSNRVSFCQIAKFIK